MSVGERLSQALARSRRSKHWLHKALQEREPPVRGSAYASVRSYCDGTNERPPLEFLLAAAEVLGVREAWLRTGQGKPYAGEEALSTYQEGMLDEEALRDSVFGPDFLAALEEHTKYGPSWLEGMRRIVLVAFADTWYRLARARAGGQEPETLPPKLGVGIFRILMRPVELVGAGKRIDLSGQPFTDYALAALGAMNQALNVPREMTPEGDVTA